MSIPYRQVTSSPIKNSKASCFCKFDEIRFWETDSYSRIVKMSFNATLLQKRNEIIRTLLIVTVFFLFALKEAENSVTSCVFLPQSITEREVTNLAANVKMKPDRKIKSFKKKQLLGTREKIKKHYFEDSAEFRSHRVTQIGKCRCGS